eukprot:TRINITY_DN21940_c0_g1_i2.p1 TRINITY_DN21940_c0_g1~~TRINITY_DN21940_c0_g1_i2.p1  ORF type:complete len:150 (-),score=7.33 TRINITY_DN21940_c0_g1_i2:417-866(-)
MASAVSMTSAASLAAAARLAPQALQTAFRPNVASLPAQPLRLRAVRRSAVVVAAADGDAPPAAPALAKGNIVRVDKEKYINSVEFMAVDHPKYFTGLDYIYQNRGEVLDLKDFGGKQFALLSWPGVPTPPAWLPVDMLIKAPKLEYTRS